MNAIAKTLDMTPTKESTLPGSDEPMDAEFEIITRTNSDYDFAREKVKSVITSTVAAVEEIKMLAVKSQDPEAYSALSRVLKEFVKANRELMEIKRLESDINPIKDQSRIEQIQNNLFVGSTKELGEFIANMKK